jgi:formylglycine-generating enzyme required for sulfatase activity
VTNNQAGDKLNPKIQQELLNHLRVGGNLTIGNITQQIVTVNLPLGTPEQQELMRLVVELVKVIAGARYTPEIHKVPPLNPTASLDAAVIAPQSSPPTTSTFEFKVVTVDAQGQETKRSRKQAQCFVEILGDAVKLEMVSIPDGKFTMGAPPEEYESCEDERPRHIVSIKSFFMGRYPITQAQWRAIASLPKIKHDLDPDPSCFKGDNRPIERVSWYDAEEFCDRLSKETKRVYRLPSEAEWEYACRARTATPFHFGATLTTNLANFCEQDQSMNKVERKQTTDVGSFPANAFGLYEMHGNVWEWCADNRHEDYQDAPSDGSVWVINGNSEYRILRGGSWDCFPTFCRCTYRSFENPQVKDKEFGFRVVCCI